MHSALTVIIDTNLVLQRYQSYLLMADYLWEAGFSKKKKKNYAKLASTEAVTNSALLHGPPVQI